MNVESHRHSYSILFVGWTTCMHMSLPVFVSFSVFCCDLSDYSSGEEGESLLYAQVLRGCVALLLSSRCRCFPQGLYFYFPHSNTPRVSVFCSSSHPVSCTSMSITPTSMYNKGGQNPEKIPGDLLRNFLDLIYSVAGWVRSLKVIRL